MLDRTELTQSEEKAIVRYTFFWSFVLLLMVPAAAWLSGENMLSLPHDFLRILTRPSKLVTDYFEIGGAGAAFLNAGLCGLACSLSIVIVKAKPTATLLAGYFLVIAHCFYGLNFLNMWLPFLGIPVYCKVMKKDYREMLHISFFCTSLGPFISDFLFRYTLGDSYSSYFVHVTVWGVLIAIVFSLVSGFVVPALLPGTTKMHRGYNLYKAGLAIGLYGMFAYAFFYKTMGISAPEVVTRYNRIYELNGRSYNEIADLFFTVVFVGSLLYGFEKNGKSFKGYKELANSDGLNGNFPLQFGMPLTLINIGCCGLATLIALHVFTAYTTGAGFTGPTIGVTIAAITFAAAGQTPKNVFPIVVGYILLMGLVTVVCSVTGLTLPATISSQGYINGLAFATGLCPFVGKYGKRYGVMAGMLNAILCTSTSAMHGGFVLYNGGLAAGLTALLMIPILDFYGVKTLDQKEKNQ